MRSVLIIVLLAIIATMCSAHWPQLEPEMMLHTEKNRMPSDDYSTEYPYKIPVDDFPTERSITGYLGGKDKYDEITFSVSGAYANSSEANLSVFPLVWGCQAYKKRYIDAVVIGPCDGNKFVKKTQKEIKKYPFANTVDVNTQCFYPLIQEAGDERGILNEPYTNNTFYYPNGINSQCIRTSVPVCSGMHNIIYRYKITQPGNYRIVYWSRSNKKVDYSMALGVRGSGRSSLESHKTYTYLIGKAYSVIGFNNKRARVECPYTLVSNDWHHFDDANDPDLTNC